MATATASPPGVSPPPATAAIKSPSLTPLNTSLPQARRKTSNQRPTSLINRRVSSYSTTARSVPPISRPESTVFPAYVSNPDYTLVRDFAYPWIHPMHYGTPSEDSVATPASESRRSSDPSIVSWETSRAQWAASPRRVPESTNSWSQRDQLPARAFNDGGPPYSEDEDLQSPIVKTSRSRKHRSDRGRSPGAAASYRSVILGPHGNRVEEYRPTAGDADEDDGPGGEIETYATDRYHRSHPHRDSNFAKPLQRVGEQDDNSPYDDSHGGRSSEGYNSDEEGVRYSKDYSFSIASPDEEMHGKAVALFDFEAEHENELPLHEGQIILVSYRHGQGWLVAEDPVSGESGLVPEEFVRLARHIEGGINGYNNLVDNEGEILTPMTNDGGSATTPTIPHHVFDKDREIERGRDRDHQAPAIQSSFSTHTRDFSPRPRTGTSASTSAKDEMSKIGSQKT